MNGGLVITIKNDLESFNESSCIVLVHGSHQHWHKRVLVSHHTSK